MHLVSKLGVSRTFSLSTVFGSAGSYKTNFFGTASGTYSFHFVGNANAPFAIDETFTCNAPGTFFDVRSF